MTTAFPDGEQGRTWAAGQKDRLLESRVDMVIDAVASTPCRNKAVTEARDALLNHWFGRH